MTQELRETAVAARAGDSSAFETLFAGLMPELIAFLRFKAGGVVGPRESVHDLAQSVCREMLLDLHEYEADEAVFRKKLFLQATRKIIDRHRYQHRAGRDPAREVGNLGADVNAESVLGCYATICTPSRVVSAREELDRIEAAIRELPENQREAVGMSRIMGLDYRDVAAQLGCSESAARGLVARGLAKLAQLLDVRDEDIA